jgi:adenine phosphoribosyltransferase
MVGNPNHGGMVASAYTMDLRSKIRVVPDFPKPGVSFKDITTLLKDGAALRYVVDRMADHFKDSKVDVILGVESRGFLFGAPLAYKMGTGFVLVRKPGKLPSGIVRASYELEYGSDSLEIHRDAIEPGQRVLLVDDLLATGGTMAAAADLVKQLQGEIAGFAFAVELTYLNGRDKLGDEEILSLVCYDS